MARLEELLRLPSWRKQQQAWENLTTGDTLIRALQEAVQQGGVGEAVPLLHVWQEVIDNADEQRQSQWRREWEIANRLLACAVPALESKALEDIPNPTVEVLFPLLHAAAEAVGVPCDHDADHGTLRMALPTHGWFEANEVAPPSHPARAVDLIFTGLASKVARTASHSRVSWGWDVTRRLVDAPRQVMCSHEIAVAGVEGIQGFHATLVLEVLAPGNEGVFHHPDDAFVTYADADFVAAMQDAWHGAHELIHQQEQTVPSWDGRWRLLRERRPATAAHDRSASGAAARGWWYALTHKVPDEGVIVIAQVDPDNVMQMKGVDGVSAKTQAIAQDPRFDTIVVASKQDEEAALQALGNATHICIRNLADT